jgi:predicted nucleotidyltransferase
VVTYGPSLLIGRALAGIDGIDEAYIHGSWAARFHGEPGGPPGDVDVIVVGQPDRRAVDAALAGLETGLSREVNVTYITRERWRNTDDPFIGTIRSRPLVSLETSDASERLMS